MVATCTEDNRQVIDQSTFWDTNGIHWDAHRIGWAIAGGCAALSVLITLVNVLRHARHYTNPPEQRQVIRILYMPPVYGVVSFFSYRYFRSFTYYSLAEAAYESVTISAFLLLLIEYVAATASNHDANNALLRKDKTPLIFPFCFWRFRPTKAYFMYTLKWSVLQYVIIRPAISIAGIVAEKFNVLCASGAYSIHFAEVYLEAIDFVSISVALYGLVVFYALVREELAGRRPLAKFLAIKLIVMFTFYQSFVFSTLQSHGKIKATDYWTSTNIADGLNALAICIEMVFFSAYMMWAYTAGEYIVPGAKATGIFRPLWDSVNYADFLWEIGGSLKFFFDYARGKPDTRGVRVAMDGTRKVEFGEAFGVEGHANARKGGARPQNSSDEVVPLTPYAGAQDGTPPGMNGRRMR